jgi:hypothetical protein
MPSINAQFAAQQRIGCQRGALIGQPTEYLALDIRQAKTSR